MNNSSIKNIMPSDNGEMPRLNLNPINEGIKIEYNQMKKYGMQIS